MINVLCLFFGIIYYRDVFIWCVMWSFCIISLTYTKNRRGDYPVSRTGYVLSFVRIVHVLWKIWEKHYGLPFFQDMVYKPTKLSQTGLVFGLWSEFISRSVHAELGPYKSPRAEVMICIPRTVVNRQTHTSPAILLTQPIVLKVYHIMPRKWQLIITCSHCISHLQLNDLYSTCSA